MEQQPTNPLWLLLKYFNEQALLRKLFTDALNLLAALSFLQELKDFEYSLFFDIQSYWNKDEFNMDENLP